jgi:hypothetical protein
MNNTNLPTQTTSSILLLKLATATLVYILFTLLFTGHSSAATIQVSGTCSLDNAVTSANTNTTTSGCVSGDPGLDTVNIPAGTITLTSDPVEYTESIAFHGEGVGNTIIDADYTTYYAFSNHSTFAPDTNLTVSGITFKNFGTRDATQPLIVIQLSSASGDLSVSNANFENMVADFNDSVYNSAIKTLSSGVLSVDNVKVLKTELRHGTDTIILRPIEALNQPTSVSISNYELADTTVTGARPDTEAIIYSIFFDSIQSNMTNIYVHHNNLVDGKTIMYGSYTVSSNNGSVLSFRLSDNISVSTSGSGGIIGLICGGSIVTYDDIDISNNSTTDGSALVGIYTADTSTTNVSNYSFTANTATYGSIPLTDLSQYAIIGNLTDDGTLNLSNSTIANNTGTGSILLTLNQSAPGSDMPKVNIFNVTSADNEISFPGATNQSSVYIDSSSSASQPSSAVSLQNTLLSNNTLNGSPANCSSNGLLASSGHNLSSDSTCTSSFNKASDINNTDPLLDSLSTPPGSFGPMRTLQSTSPAVDSGIDLVGAPDDQRGVLRPQKLSSDIGAYEVLADTVTVPVIKIPNTGIGNSVPSFTKITTVILAVIVLRAVKFRSLVIARLKNKQ